MEMIDFSLLQEHTVNLYNLKEEVYEIQDVPARSLLVGERFDLFAKLYYIENRTLNYSLAREVYCQHIKAFNPDLKEPGREDKEGYDDFVNTFDSLIGDLGVNGFDSQKSLIPVDEFGVILDGAHRLSALAYADKQVRIVRFKNVRSKCRFDYAYFLKRGLSWDIADIIAEEMVKWRPNMLIACLWPRMGNKDSKKIALDAINAKYPLKYTKTIVVNFESFVRFIAKVYEDQPWVGCTENNFAGAHDKALRCFASNKQITFALFEADNLNDVIAFKENLRLTFQNEKHSIHITDNVDETKDITEIILEASEVAKWNTFATSFLQKIKGLIYEKKYYYQHVVLINIKVSIAKMLREF